MRLDHKMYRAVRRFVMPPAFEANHIEYSMIGSSEDEPMPPTERLLTLAIEAVTTTRQLRLEFRDRAGHPISTVNHWPGEHYRLLAGLVAVLKPKLVIEIGTGSGGSTLAMRQTLPKDGRIVTFDLIGWQEAPEGVLRAEDFEDGRLVQYRDDVSQAPGFAKHQEMLEQADLFFIDAAKDGFMEQRLITRMRALLKMRTSPILIFDDIRLWNMLRVWRDLPWPKLDLTSFGHWTGTGLAEWRK